jgi:DDE superfamily endonuclease
VSSIECICANGSAIDAFIILKGVHFRTGLFDHATPGMKIATSKKGWTSKGPALAWLRHHFEAQTRDSINPKTPRLLIIDGHKCYGKDEFSE